MSLLRAFVVGSVAASLCGANATLQSPQPHRFTPTSFYTTYSFAHPPALRIKPGDRVVTKTIDAAGVDWSDKSVWIANVVDPNFTVVARMRKALLPKR